MAIVTVDFDGTLYQGNSFQAMFEIGKQEFSHKEWLMVANGTAKSTLYRLINGKKAFRQEFFRGFAKTFQGKSKDEIKDFFEKIVQISENKINYKLIQHLKQHQEKGDTVIILSGVLMPLLEAFADYLKLDVHIIGTELKFYPNGLCSGDISPIVNGEVKVTKLVEWIHRHKKINQLHVKQDQKIWAYADSMSDIPVFHFVDHPVVVNPSSGMKEVALQNSWQIFA